MIILRFLVSHEAQCCLHWTTDVWHPNYTDQHQIFFLNSLNIHFGLVAKTILIALPTRVIYLSVLDPIFFFYGKLQVLSKWGLSRNNQQK